MGAQANHGLGRLDGARPAFTEEPDELCSTIRAFLEAKSPESAVRELMDPDFGYDHHLPPDKAVDHRQDISEQVVISEDALESSLLGAADEGSSCSTPIWLTSTRSARLAPQAPFDDVM
jgi:hypothetical protein